MLCLVILFADFRNDQLAFARVKVAEHEAEAALVQLFAEKQLAYPPSGLILVAFKKESVIEAWVPNGKTYAHLKDYRICARSGQLGRKHRAGDGQVPEGFYDIAAFNPSSSYYLSLKVSYPNAADRILNRGAALGGDIFIHGDCVTIGCMPIEDAHIKELYWLAVQARSHGAQTIPVYIFPFRFQDAAVEHAADANGEWAFWDNLRAGYEQFKREPRMLAVTVDSHGHYLFGLPR